MVSGIRENTLSSLAILCKIKASTWIGNGSGYYYATPGKSNSYCCVEIKLNPIKIGESPQKSGFGLSEVQDP